MLRRFESGGIDLLGTMFAIKSSGSTSEGREATLTGPGLQKKNKRLKHFQDPDSKH